MRVKRKQKRSFHRIVLIAVIGFTVLAGIVAGMVVRSEVQAPKQKTSSEGEKMAAEQIIHVMLMGVDRRQEDVGRSDTLMVATVDPRQKKAALFSIPRDTRVKIAGHGYDKINHAYAFGGYELTRKTVENLLGVPMDYYVLVDLRAFERVVDAIGGVDINVEKRMYYEDPWDDNGGLIIDLYPGEQYMDGARAIQYVRYRDGEGDIGRVRRQQNFMKAVLAELISPQILPRLPKIIEEVGSTIQTDMPVSEMLSLAGIVKDMHDNGMRAEMLPGKPAYVKDISYWLPDIRALRAMLAEEIGMDFHGEIAEAADDAAKEYAKDLPQGLQVIEEAGKQDDRSDSQKPAEKKREPAKPNEISVLVINSSGINGAGAQVADILLRKGFIISGVETGKTNAREHTTITTSTENTDIFYGMPFPCTIMDGGEKNQAVVNIGQDYRP